MTCNGGGRCGGQRKAGDQAGLAHGKHTAACADGLNLLGFDEFVPSIRGSFTRGESPAATACHDQH